MEIYRSWLVHLIEKRLLFLKISRFSLAVMACLGAWLVLAARLSQHRYNLLRMGTGPWFSQ
jgi:hypothetical protein